MVCIVVGIEDVVMPGCLVAFHLFDVAPLV